MQKLALFKKSTDKQRLFNDFNGDRP